MGRGNLPNQAASGPARFIHRTSRIGSRPDNLGPGQENSLPAWPVRPVEADVSMSRSIMIQQFRSSMWLTKTTVVLHPSKPWIPFPSPFSSPLSERMRRHCGTAR